MITRDDQRRIAGEAMMAADALDYIIDSGCVGELTEVYLKKKVESIKIHISNIEKIAEDEDVN